MSEQLTAWSAPARTGLTAQLGGLYAIWLREVKRAVRDRGQFVGGVSRPLLWVLILGIGLNPYFRGEVYGEVRFVIPYTYLQFIFPAVIALNIMYTSVQSAVSTIWDREFGFLREILVSPMPRFTILLGKIFGGTTVALFHGSLVLALASFADISLSAGDIVRGLGLMFLLAFGLTSLGVVIANRIRSFEGFGVFSNAVILPLYFTSSSIFPLDPSLTAAQTKVVYPEWLVMMVQWNPFTYAVDALRGAFIHFNQFDPKLGPIVLVVMAAIVLSDRLARLPEGVTWRSSRAIGERGSPTSSSSPRWRRCMHCRPTPRLARCGAPACCAACVPFLYPPLVTDDPAAPGIDIELLRDLAKHLGLRLDLSRNDAMGRDFNPRSWHVTRAQCEVLAGGIVASPVTKSFLETSPILCGDRMGLHHAQAPCHQAARDRAVRQPAGPSRHSIGGLFGARPYRTCALSAGTHDRIRHCGKLQRVGARPAGRSL